MEGEEGGLRCTRGRHKVFAPPKWLTSQKSLKTGEILKWAVRSLNACPLYSKIITTLHGSGDSFIERDNRVGDPREIG